MKFFPMDINKFINSLLLFSKFISCIWINKFFNNSKYSSSLRIKHSSSTRIRLETNSKLLFIFLKLVS